MKETVRGKERTYCHTFFELKDGSALAFFQFLDSDDQAEMKLDSRNSLNHVALSSTLVDQERLRGSLDAAGVEHRTTDHGYCVSLYVTDPDGLTVEFTADPENVAEINECVSMRRELPAVKKPVITQFGQFAFGSRTNLII